jgi:hypothetical protein
MLGAMVRMYRYACIVFYLTQNCVGMHRDHRIKDLEKKFADLAQRDAKASKQEKAIREQAAQEAAYARTKASLREYEIAVHAHERKVRPKSPRPTDMSWTESQARRERDRLERSETENEKKLADAHANFKKAQAELDGMTGYRRTTYRSLAYSSAFWRVERWRHDIHDLEMNLDTTRKKIEAQEETIHKERRYAAYIKTPEYIEKEAKWREEESARQQRKREWDEEEARRKTAEREAQDRAANDEARAEEIRRLVEEEDKREYEHSHPFGGECYDPYG